MNVYELNYNSFGYGSGICIVAADSEEEALDVANENGYRDMWEEPRLINGLTYDSEKPFAITSNYYQE